MNYVAYFTKEDSAGEQEENQRSLPRAIFHMCGTTAEIHFLELYGLRTFPGYVKFISAGQGIHSVNALGWSVCVPQLHLIPCIRRVRAWLA